MIQNNPPSSFKEASRTLPVLAHADVLVLGGGPGGCGAAIAAARNGARTVIVERFGAFGGTWTSGLLSSIMPFPYVRGIFAEIIQELDKTGGWNESARWDPYESGAAEAGGWGHGGVYDPELLKSLLDRMIEDAGVTPFFFLQVVSVFREGDRLQGVVVESKEGRFVMTADVFIDASGDGDVCHLAGVATDYGREEDGGVQPMTLMFKMDGVDDVAAEAHKQRDPRLADAWGAAKRAGEVSVPRENVLLARTPQKGQWVFNTTRILGLDGTRVRDVTQAMIAGRRQAFEIAAFMRKHIDGFAHARVCETGAHVGVRETRRVRCDYTMTERDILDAVSFADGIARGSWYIDIHNPSGEGTEIRPPSGNGYYEIPYRSLCAQGVENLLVASRCIDCSHEAHAAIRITPQVTAIGQAAGTAAALSVKNGLQSIRKVDAGLLRETLRSQNVCI